ncbi:MAG TPA: HPr(Ser) kinase/phosphatase [Longimicrobiales bacterium]|nr:HPr(Ser) kinase/phosphatase [Longimicrobiales bacterium]
MKTLTVDELFKAKRQTLGLELLTARCDLERKLASATVSSPGLVLAGYTDRFPKGRIQILGETEMSFLQSLPEDQMRETLERFFSLDMPAVVVTKAQDVPAVMLEIACAQGVAVFRSSLKTGDFYRRIQPYLEEQFAPSTTIHGSLADVYGVGLLFVGRSGIGKSECVLDLVERGHRLVADDLVHVTRRGLDVLIGRGHALQRHHMEIRGIGIIDIPALFGIRAIRQQKRIELVVQLEEWNDQAYYDRTGLESDEVEILGVKLPKVTVPLNPGKNITVLSEVVAMNLLLKYAGVHSAQAFNQKLQSTMRPLREYLEEDYE